MQIYKKQTFKDMAYITIIFVFHYLCITYYFHIPSITINVVSSNPAHGEVYSIQHCVITFVSDLRQVSGFLREVLWLPLPIKLKYC